MKLCVGASDPSDLADWQQRVRKNFRGQTFHDTRMFPRRAAEILDGGSMFWVIANRFSLRQRITEIERITAGDGTPKCRISFDPELVAVEPLGRRPFQGWRYLDDRDTPSDVASGQTAQIDQALRVQLADLGLL